MCGIAGWVDLAGGASPEPVARMVAALAHRGPDEDGLWRDPAGAAVLGHRRLKVLDLSPCARQPMLGPSGAVLVYNGEVYSFPRVRAALEEAGRPVTSTGDTEVVLAALETWGSAALDRFVGMFALALWRPGERRLLLARDRLGVKPLFWTRVGDGLAFASELPALLAHPGVARRLDREALARWLQLGYSAGEETLLAGVRRLPPGHLLEADADGVRVRRWYDVLERIAPLEVGERAAADALAPVLEAAVGDRLVADVPLGCFLSGGVDSTLVAATAAAAGARPEAVTVTFPGGADESGAAAATAAALGLEHRVEVCTAEEMLGVIARWPTLAGDPLADPSLAPTWVVSGAARRRLTVALSGDGGDELCGGYPRLRAMPRLGRLVGSPGAAVLGAVPLPARRWVTKLGAAVAEPDPWSAYAALQGVWAPAAAARLLGTRELPPPWDPGLLRRLEGFPEELRYRLLDLLTFLPERVLAKVDRASMFHGLEVRVPLLDHRLVEAVLGLPARVVRNKRVLRRLLAERLPGQPPPRRKRGFEVPLSDWLRGPLRERVGAALASDRAADLGLDRARLGSHWATHQARRADHAEGLFAAAVLVWWSERWL